MVLTCCAKGDYNLLQEVKEEEFTEAELYLKTADDCSSEKFAQLPKHIKIVSVHQPTYIFRNGKYELLDLTNKDGQKESIESVKRTIEFAKEQRIPKVVIHCSSYNPSESKDKAIQKLAEIMDSLYSDEVEISFEIDVLWFNTYFPRRNLLTSVEDFKKLDKALDGKMLITLDVEHIFLTSTFNLFMKEYDTTKFSEQEFEEKYREFIKGKDEIIINNFKKNFKQFFDELKNKIAHMHINGSDYKHYLFDPETYIPLQGEHLPLTYDNENVKDRLDYNFIAKQFKRLPQDKQIYIIFELGIRKEKYNFQEEMFKSKLFLGGLLY